MPNQLPLGHRPRAIRALYRRRRSGWPRYRREHVRRQGSRVVRQSGGQPLRHRLRLPIPPAATAANVRRRILSRRRRHGHNVRRAPPEFRLKPIGRSGRKLDMLQDFASATDGKAVVNTNDLTGAVRKDLRRFVGTPARLLLGKRRGGRQVSPDRREGKNPGQRAQGTRPDGRNEEGRRSCGRQTGLRDVGGPRVCTSRADRTEARLYSAAVPHWSRRDRRNRKCGVWKRPMDEWRRGEHQCLGERGRSEARRT